MTLLTRLFGFLGRERDDTDTYQCIRCGEAFDREYYECPACGIQHAVARLDDGDDESGRNA